MEEALSPKIPNNFIMKVDGIKMRNKDEILVSRHGEKIRLKHHLPS